VEEELEINIEMTRQDDNPRSPATAAAQWNIGGAGDDENIIHIVTCPVVVLFRGCAPVPHKHTVSYDVMGGWMFVVRGSCVRVSSVTGPVQGKDKGQMTQIASPSIGCAAACTLRGPSCVRVREQKAKANDDP